MKKFILILLFLFFMLPVLSDEITILPSQTGLVKNVQYVDLNENNAIQTKQIAEVQILTGSFKGETIELDNMLTGNPYYDIKLKKNTKVILHAEEDENNIVYSIEDIRRSGSLIWLGLVFCALVIYVGRKKGLYSLVSIVITIFLIIHALSPLILFGVNPVLAVVLVCLISTAVTMYFVGGFNQKSSAAVIGSVLSLIFAAILSYIVIHSANLTGFNGENSMFLYTAHPELDFVLISVATMVLATLGAVMDVAMSIASTINEIHLADNSKTIKELFVSGMNVGRDVIGTMANTLILVYLGSALPLILLSGNVDWQKFINLNQVVTEISSALIGSIAIVICVPFTAIIAATLIKNHKQTREIDINF